MLICLFPMASVLDTPSVAAGIAFNYSTFAGGAAREATRQPVSSSRVAAVACKRMLGGTFYFNFPPLPIFSSCIEHTLNCDKDQREKAHANASPPRTQSAVELEDGHDGLIDQDTKRSADHTANATEQRCTPYHYRGDGVQLHPGRKLSIAREQRNTEYNAGQSGTEAAERIDSDFRASYR
jgi:hypothetical protein